MLLKKRTILLIVCIFFASILPSWGQKDPSIRQTEILNRYYQDQNAFFIADLFESLAKDIPDGMLNWDFDEESRSHHSSYGNLYLSHSVKGSENFIALEFDDYTMQFSVKTCEYCSNDDLDLLNIFSQNSFQFTANYSEYMHESGQYKNGIRTGKWEKKHEYIDVPLGGIYKNGLRTGKWREWCANTGSLGNLDELHRNPDLKNNHYLAEGNYGSNGLRIGAWTYEHMVGSWMDNISCVIEYIDGNPSKANCSILYLKDDYPSVSCSYNLEGKPSFNQFDFLDRSDAEDGLNIAAGQMILNLPIDLFFANDQPLISSQMDGETTGYLIPTKISPQKGHQSEVGNFIITLPAKNKFTHISKTGEWKTITKEGVVLATSQSTGKSKSVNELIRGRIVFLPNNLEESELTDGMDLWIHKERTYFATAAYHFDNEISKAMISLSFFDRVTGKYIRTEFISEEAYHDRNWNPDKNTKAYVSVSSRMIKKGSLNEDSISVGLNKNVASYVFRSIIPKTHKDFMVFSWENMVFLHGDTLYALNPSDGKILLRQKLSDHPFLANVDGNRDMVFLDDRYLLFEDFEYGPSTYDFHSRSGFRHVDLRNYRCTAEGPHSANGLVSFWVTEGKNAMSLLLKRAYSDPDVFKTLNPSNGKLNAANVLQSQDLLNTFNSTGKDGHQFYEWFWQMDTIPTWMSDLTDLYQSPIANNINVASENRKVVLANTSDREIVFYNGQNENRPEKFVYLRALKNDATILYTPDFYYFLLEGDLKEMYFVQNDQVYPFEQFDLKYNRPDIVLERMGYADSTLIAAYRKAYEKRLKKSGFTEEMLAADLHMPELEIVEPTKIPKSTTSGQIDVSLKGKDPKYPLNRLNVWINNVPIYGTKGLPIQNGSPHVIDTTVRINLSSGINKIQVSIMNDAGTESLKQTFTVENTKIEKPNLYFIGIGADRFQSSQMNLKYAAKDIKDLAEVFKNMSDQYQAIYIDTFLHENVTSAILESIEKRLANTSIHDQIILAYSGHGVLESDLEYYLSTYNMDFLHPSQKGIHYSSFNDLLDGIPARKKLVFIDACHSGELDKDEVTSIAQSQSEQNEVQFRSFSNGSTVQIGLGNSFELMKKLFSDLRRGTGAHIISSSSGVEYSLEGDKWKNGVFTYAIKEGIEKRLADGNSDGKIMVSELRNFVSNRVSELTNGKQTPTSRQENLEFDFKVW